LCLQPMMMPLLREMPEGRVGIRVMQQAVHTSLFGEFDCNGSKQSTMSVRRCSTSSHVLVVLTRCTQPSVWQPCCRTCSGGGFDTCVAACRCCTDCILWHGAFWGCPVWPKDRYGYVCYRLLRMSQPCRGGA
jgi:hypothetical protein